MAADELSLTITGGDEAKVKAAFETLVRALREAGSEASGGIRIGAGRWYYVEDVDAPEETLAAGASEPIGEPGEAVSGPISEPAEGAPA